MSRRHHRLAGLTALAMGATALAAVFATPTTSASFVDTETISVSAQAGTWAVECPGERTAATLCVGQPDDHGDNGGTDGNGERRSGDEHGDQNGQPGTGPEAESTPSTEQPAHEQPPAEQPAAKPPAGDSTSDRPTSEPEGKPATSEPGSAAGEAQPEVPAEPSADGTTATGAAGAGAPAAD